MFPSYTQSQKSELLHRCERITDKSPFYYLLTVDPLDSSPLQPRPLYETIQFPKKVFTYTRDAILTKGVPNTLYRLKFSPKPHKNEEPPPPAPCRSDSIAVPPWLRHLDMDWACQGRLRTLSLLINHYRVLVMWMRWIRIGYIRSG